MGVMTISMDASYWNLPYIRLNRCPTPHAKVDAPEVGLGEPAVLTEDGEPVSRGTQGLLSLQRPWPGMLPTLYKDDERYVQTYWEKWGPSTNLVGDASREHQIATSDED
jgi:acyl-coenzyme A synthetase/AMP-(fatty) acid ligase